MTIAPELHTTSVSVTEAASRGVAGLIKEAEAGEDVIVARRGRPVAAVVSMRRLTQLRDLERDLRDVALILARVATDSGRRTDLDTAITAFGFDRAELEAELDEDRTAGRP
jgi:prevent-host-death family protein